MAVVGNAKNARLTFRPVYDGDSYYITAYARGRAFRLYAELYEEEDSAPIALTRMKPTAAVIGSYSAWFDDGDTFVLEVIDSTLKVFQNGTLKITATDTSNAVSGNWEITKGTFVSFENLDAPTYSLSYNANGGTGTLPATQTGASHYTAALQVDAPYKVEEDSPNLVYTGTWTTNNAYSISNGVTKYGSGTISHTFSGTQVELIGYRAPVSWGYGTGTVTIDGGTPTAVTWVADPAIAGQSIYKSPVLSAGTHTIVIATQVLNGTIDYLEITPVPPLTKAGYTFVGWNTAADGTGTFYAAGARYPATGDMTADMTLYAVWVRSITRRRTNLIQGGY